MGKFQTVGEYRKDKDRDELRLKFKLEYPEYYDFMDSFQRKYYNKDKTKFTMGADYGFYYGLIGNI